MKYANSTRHLSVLLLAASATLALNPLQAAEAGAMPMPMNHPEEPANTKAVHGKGVVRTIDATANTITLSHDPIAEINWPAMTMAFKVTGDAEEQVEVGDVIEFDLTGEGADYMVTRIEKAE